jgi:hypothetical protein
MNSTPSSARHDDETQLNDITQPVGWKVCSKNLRGYQAFGPVRPSTEARIFPTKQEAIEFRDQLRDGFGGEDFVVCVQPVFVGKAKRERHFQGRQADLKAAWPLQARPGKL